MFVVSETGVTEISMNFEYAIALYALLFGTDPPFVEKNSEPTPGTPDSPRAQQPFQL